MTPPIYSRDPSKGTTDDRSAGNVHANPGCEGSPPSTIQPISYDDRDLLECDAGSSVSCSRTISNQPGGLSTQNSDVVGILPPMNLRYEDGSTGSSTMQHNHDSITTYTNWCYWRNTSENTTAPADEAIGLCDADFDLPENSGIFSNNLAPAHTVAALGCCAANDGGPLYYETLHKMVDGSPQIPGQLKDTLVLSPQKLRDACTFCKKYAEIPSGMLTHFNFTTPPAKPQLTHDNTCISSNDIVNSIFQTMDRGLRGLAPRIRCWDCKPHLNAAGITSLRFGLNRKITLYRLENGKPITFVCCNETFPSLDWAEEATKAFLKGAGPWAKAGLIFKQVDRSKPAHSRIAFSLFPSNLDCSILAEAFFPSMGQPEERTLWVYLLAFYPYYRRHMAGYMGHEAGHIGGARHGFNEHLLPDGSEMPELKPVIIGTDNPRSIINYHDNPVDYVVQSSDIREMQDIRGYSNDKYEGYEIIKIEPEAQVYPQMASFESIAEYLLKEA